MAKDFSTREDSNLSSNPGIHEVSDPARRILLQGGLAAAFAPLAGCALGGAKAGPRLGLEPVPPSRSGTVNVAPGYTATPLAPWGKPVGLAGAMPAWKWDAPASAVFCVFLLGIHAPRAHAVPQTRNSGQARWHPAIPPARPHDTSNITPPAPPDRRWHGTRPATQGSDAGGSC